MADLPATADAVVIGGGVHGASVAYHLAQKRVGRVVVIEKDFVACGMSGRSAAVVRRFYRFSFFTRTSSRSADIFRNWREVIGGGDPGYREVGHMYLASEQKAVNLEQNVQRARELGALVQLVSPGDVRGLVPLMRVDDVAVASWEEKGGYVDPATATNALANRARELGAAIVQYTPVTEILTVGGRVTGVRTPRGDVSSPVVVNCASLGASPLLAPLGIEIEIKAIRAQMCVFHRPPELAGHPVVTDTITAFYTRPDLGDVTLASFLAHDEVVNPVLYRERVDPERVERVSELLAGRIPAMENALVGEGYAGLHDATPDRQPVLGAIPEYEGLYVDFGWSGHGFKHAPIMGDIISDVVLEGRSADFDLTPFRWTRFREGDFLPSGTATLPPPERDI